MSDALARIVVVGNGIAGLTACDALRERGFEGELLIVGSEASAAYSRPALSKALLKLDADLNAHELPAATHGARELRGVAAVGLDPARRRVFLSDGRDLPFDGLVIATGARARKLSEHPEELTLRDVADAHALRNVLAGGPSVVIVGGGVLGMEIASGALAAGCTVTLLANSTPMAKQLGHHVAAILVTSAVAQGLRIAQVEAATIEEHDGELVAVTKTGEHFCGEVIISAVGDVPNVAWLADSGLLRDGQLLADAAGRVAPGIVAAGDVTMWSQAARTPLWTSAIEQARVAAAALLDPNAPPLSFQSYFWTEQFGHAVKAMGPLPVSGEPEVLAGEATGAPALLRWTHPDGTRTVIAVDQRIPIPKLRRLAAAE